jgi:hypothetical protein
MRASSWLAALALLACGLTTGLPAYAGGAPRLTDAEWGADGALALTLAPGGHAVLTVAVAGGTLTRIPDACTPSTVVRSRSYLTEDHRTLRCLVTTPTAVTVAVTARSDGADPVTASVQEDKSPARTLEAVVPAADATPPSLRLLSSPDFTNADIGDLRDGPSSWRPGRSANSTNRSYERGLDAVLDDWAGHDPDDVLVAGDLVDGRWGRDQRHTGNFGPVGTPAQRRTAVRRAAATYYPQWLQRFRDHGLDVHPAVGDHEYGDNPWPAGKRALASTFQAAFARVFTRGRYPDHPQGPHAGTAYAFRPSPDVQVVSIDPFDVTRAHARIRIDRQQRSWLVRVLKKARADGLPWIVVQGHVPVLWPVRTRGSSGLHYPGGQRSALWRIFERYGVNVYLCGEVHDTTASSAGGVLQLAHGGLFQYALTTYALLDVRPDRIDVSLNDFDMSVKDAPDHSRLWETVRGGLRKRVHVGAASTIGTLSLAHDGTITDRSGILDPYKPSR